MTIDWSAGELPVLPNKPGDADDIVAIELPGQPATVAVDLVGPFGSVDSVAAGSYRWRVFLIASTLSRPVRTEDVRLNTPKEIEAAATGIFHRGVSGSPVFVYNSNDGTAFLAGLVSTQHLLPNLEDIDPALRPQPLRNASIVSVKALFDSQGARLAAALDAKVPAGAGLPCDSLGMRLLGLVRLGSRQESDSGLKPALMGVAERSPEILRKQEICFRTKSAWRDTASMIEALRDLVHMSAMALSTATAAAQDQPPAVAFLNDGKLAMAIAAAERSGVESAEVLRKTISNRKGFESLSRTLVELTQGTLQEPSRRELESTVAGRVLLDKKQ